MEAMGAGIESEFTVLECDRVSANAILTLVYRKRQLLFASKVANAKAGWTTS
jgi:hypothetical protein